MATCDIQIQNIEVEIWRDQLRKVGVNGMLRKFDESYIFKRYKGIKIEERTTEVIFLNDKREFKWKK